MALDQKQTNTGPQAQAAAFAASMKDLWELATYLEIHRARKPGNGKIFYARVVHLLDSKNQPIDDRQATIEEALANGAQHAAEHGGAEYRLVVYGYAEKPKARPSAKLPAEIALGEMTVKLGEGDAQVEGDTNMLKEAGGFVKQAASAMADMNSAAASQHDGYEKLLGVQHRTIEAQAAQIRTSSDTDIRGLTLQVEKERMHYDFERWKFEMEEKRAALQMEHAHEMERTRMQSALGHRALGLLEMGFKLQMLRMGMQPPPDESEPDDIPGQLRALLKTITPEEKEALIELLTDRMWDLLESASKAPNDDHATAILHRTKEEVKANKKIVFGLIQAQEVIGVERWNRLASLLVRAGVIPPEVIGK